MGTEQNPQSARRNNFSGEQISRWFLLLSENLSASNYPGVATAAKPIRENRTITVDFRNEATYFQLLGDGKAFLECVMAFIKLVASFHECTHCSPWP